MQKTLAILGLSSLLGLFCGGHILSVSGVFAPPISEAKCPDNAACNPLNLKKLAPGSLDGNCGWSTVQPDTGNVVGTDHIAVRNDKIVLTGDQFRIDSWGWVPIPPQDKVFSVKIRVRVDNLNAQTPPNFGLNIDDSANYSQDSQPWPTFTELGAMMYLRGSVGMVVGLDGNGQGGGAFKSENVVPYVGNATYTMKATIDPTQGTYDMTVRVDGGPRVVVADDYRFRREPIVGTFDSISMWVAGLDVNNEPVQVIIEKIALESDDDDD